jgi:hypothetical protein
MVADVLQPGISLGLITVFNDADEGRCYRGGRMLASWSITMSRAQEQPAPSSPPPPSGASAQPAKKERRGGPRKILPVLKLEALKVEQGRPLPAPKGLAAKGLSKYDAIFDALKADGLAVTGISAEYKSGLQKAVQTYVDSRPALKATSVLVVRDIDGATIGVWRVAKGTPGTRGVARKSGNSA